MVVKSIRTGTAVDQVVHSRGRGPSLLGLQRAFMALLDAPEIRRTRVARLHIAVRDEEYKIEPSLVADAMILDMGW